VTDGEKQARRVQLVLSEGGPMRWNPWNHVVQDHRDGTVDRELTDIEREARGLEVPWRPGMPNNHTWVE
jgi:hypothetical protein